MNKTTFKLGQRFLPTAIAAMLILAFAGSAIAREQMPEAPSCHLYAGEATVESLQLREAALNDELLHSAAPFTGDYCELANIHYKLSRMLPDRQIAYLKSCIDHSQRAVVRDPRAGVAYFFKGLCLGRLGETKGLWGSLNIIEPVRKNMEIAVKINPAIDSGGPHRALGRLYFKLPVILGGDINKSIDHLQKAVSYGPKYWENHFFLAESYFQNNQYQMARGELQQALKISSQLDEEDADSKTRAVEIQGLMKAIERNLN